MEPEWEKENGFRLKGPRGPLNNAVRQIGIRPGLNLVLVDFNPGETIRMEFESYQVPLEFSYYLSGQTMYTVEHPGGRTCFSATPGLNVASAFSQSCGVMEYRAGMQVRMVAILVSVEFSVYYLYM